jgi:hypothetical protein
MAIVQFGATVSGIRGTIGGVTFSANRTANYAKQYSRPPLSRTQKQILTRAALVDNSILWAGLTQQERDDWDTFAYPNDNEHDFDPWGVRRYLTGFQWFCRAQQRRSSLALTNPGPVPSGPAATAITGLLLDIKTYSAGGSWLTYDDNQFAAGEAIILYLAFIPGGEQRDAFRNWKLIFAQQDPINGGYDIHTQYTAAFGSLSTGWKCYGLAFKQAEAGNRSVAATATDVVS